MIYRGQSSPPLGPGAQTQVVRLGGGFGCMSLTGNKEVLGLKIAGLSQGAACSGSIWQPHFLGLEHTARLSPRLS